MLQLMPSNKTLSFNIYMSKTKEVQSLLTIIYSCQNPYFEKTINLKEFPTTVALYIEKRSFIEWMVATGIVN